MGRQLPVVTTPRDERELLRFIHSLSPIRVFRCFTPTPEELWITDWERREIPVRFYNIWPEAFPWEPAYGQTNSGDWYVSNASAAPVIEFSRGSDERKDGRVYWARSFSAAQGLAYDERAFSKLVDQVWRWIRKHGRRLSTEPYAPYYLPDAWARETG